MTGFRQVFYYAFFNMRRRRISIKRRRKKNDDNNKKYQSRMPLTRALQNDDIEPKAILDICMLVLL